MSAEGIYAVLSYVMDIAGNSSTTNSNLIVVDLTEPDYDSNNLSLGPGVAYSNNVQSITPIMAQMPCPE